MLYMVALENAGGKSVSLGLKLGYWMHTDEVVQKKKKKGLYSFTHMSVQFKVITEWICSRRLKGSFVGHNPCAVEILKVLHCLDL